MANTLYKQGGQHIATISLPQQEVKHPGQFVPEVLTGWTEGGPTDTANVPLLLDIETEDSEILNAEYHRLKGSKIPSEKNRLAQIAKELDRRNQEAT